MLSLLLSMAALVHANSKGIGIPCDVMVPVGSDNVMEQSSAAMWWAKKPAWAGTLHTLRTGDGDPTSDPTSYVPGEWTEIFIRTHEKRKQITGLVLYAENAAGAKVGSWAIPAQAPFHKPGDCVVHSNANQKPYLNTFRLSLPAGTGTVTIKALVKYGLANPNKDGAFYWPNNAHLTLSEGAPPSQQVWFEGRYGQSCTDVCAALGGTCDLATLKTGSSKALYELVKTRSTCTLPMMAGCSKASPSVTDEGCFFHDDTCVIPPPPEVPSRKCSSDCGKAPTAYPLKVGTCCNWADHHAITGCFCLEALTDNNQVYSLYTGVWSKGTPADATNMPTPAPPQQEDVTCEATLDWNRQGRRLCACTGVSGAVPPPFTPNGNVPLPGMPSKAPTPPTNAATKYPTQPPGATKAPTTPTAAATKAPTAAPTKPICNALIDSSVNCLATPRCCKAGYSCYKKDNGWSSCRETGTCTPGIYANDPPEFQTAWLCTLLGGSVEDDTAAPTSATTTTASGGATTTTAADGTTTAPDGSAVSSAGRLSIVAAVVISLLSPLCISAGPGSSAGGSSGRLALLLVLGLAFLPSSQAHNWLTSPARGNEAGENNGFNGFTSPPCPQKTTRIHAQVGPGQKFPIEWASGHGFGSFTYFAVLKAEDEKHIPKHNSKMFDEYLAEAPSTSYLSDFPVLHVAHEDHSNSLLKPGNVAASYVWIPGSDASKGVRPATFRHFGASPVVKEKTADGVKDDQRASYYNDKYPWLISVSKFTMRYDFPEDADTTMFEIPASFPPGTYVVQYIWNGYYDCVDVNVLDVPSTDIFGKAGTSTGFDRTDHCEVISDYVGYEILGDCKGIQAETDVSSFCAPLCTKANGCEVIQVMQKDLAKQVLDAGVWTGNEHLPEKCRALTEPFVCFGVKQGEPKVGPTYRISADPEDPIFYNSCFRMNTGWVYDQQCDTCPRTALEPGWAFGRECITCSEMRANAQSGGYVPRWDFTADQCRHCSNQG